jgi:hypothetical protein
MMGKYGWVGTCGWEEGLKMRLIFLKITQIQRDRPVLNLKIIDFLNLKSEILKKIKKNLERLCKKTRSNYKNIGGEIFSNLDRFVG